MSLGLALLLVGLFPALLGANSLSSYSSSVLGSFQHCKEALNTSVLGALPGGGWDNLRNVELGQVLLRDYSNCLTTEDGEYLIPDNVHVVALRETAMETRAELIDEWLQYTDSWALSINADFSFLAALNGKFSAACQKAKKYEMKYETVTTRVQVRHSVYSVKVPESPTFHPVFLEQLLQLNDYLESNQTQEAQYLAELLVRKFGTHVLTDVEAGAALVQEDQVRRKLVDSQTQEKTNITLTAALAFKFSLKTDGSWLSEDQRIQNYMQNTVASKLRSQGGLPYAPGMSLQTWQESIDNRLVAIGRAGLPLPDLIEPNTVPQLPPASVQRLATAVRNAINRYYALNAHPGCVKRGDPAFNPQANVDDGSCSAGNRANFSFGGVFQECKPVSGVDAEPFCKVYRTMNPLTGNASCTPEYEVAILHREYKTWSQPHNVCKKVCKRCWLLFTCCNDECGPQELNSTVWLSTSWCVPKVEAKLPAVSGFLFGGLYSPRNANPITRAQACPSHFYPLTLFDDLKVCVSSDPELGGAQAVPFGGFFSCQEGNPLAGIMKGQSPGFLQEMFYQDSLTDHPMKCPTGYSQHQAFVKDGCQILYCLKFGAFQDEEQIKLRMPPFLPCPASLKSNRTMALSSRLSLPATLVDQEKSGASAGSIAGALVATVAVLVAAAVGAFVLFKRRQNSRWRENQETVLINNQSHEVTETAADPGV